MSNNQKAVIQNPSDSKNVIQFALLRASRNLVMWGKIGGWVGDDRGIVDSRWWIVDGRTRKAITQRVAETRDV